ncbi:hypothetical protein DXA39_00340 [Anaerococcus nagyae]|uniref:Glycosyl transferase n=1 Tax=Anaerococcus nagyae TaxID=1755241 RepID=A0A3E2TLR0_9FIRM|nr:hypothetical protein DXA39_00340 [Anaerococcus nagyae]
MNKIKYYQKRVGFKGIIKIMLRKIGIIDFNVYEYMYDRYYSNLNKREYIQELIEWFKSTTGENVNPLIDPKTFNEKIQWLKINDSSALKTLCADKYNVRSYVSDKVGDEYLVPIYGCWDRFEDINFSELPNEMIFKSTTGSARYKIIKNKKNINFKELQNIFKSWQYLPFGYAGMEIHYLDIDRKIMCEKLLDMDGPSVADYKFHCFNGKPILVEYISDREGESHLETWFDTSWNKVNIIKDDKLSFNHKDIPESPKNLDRMLQLAEVLSEDFIYVRVDLYQIEGKIYFGELTFTPANGNHKWKGNKSQNLVGSLLRLPNEEKLDEGEINRIIEELKN